MRVSTSFFCVLVNAFPFDSPLSLKAISDTYIYCLHFHAGRYSFFVFCKSFGQCIQVSSLTDCSTLVVKFIAKYIQSVNTLILLCILCSWFMFCPPLLHRRLNQYCSITLRVVTLPSSRFDGNASITFEAGGMGSSIPSSASFDVTFYHCDTGQVWTGASLDSSEAGTAESCQLCSAVVEGDARVRYCVSVKE